MITPGAAVSPVVMEQFSVVVQLGGTPVASVFADVAIVDAGSERLVVVLERKDAMLT